MNEIEIAVRKLAELAQKYALSTKQAAKAIGRFIACLNPKQTTGRNPDHRNGIRKFFKWTINKQSNRKYTRKYNNIPKAKKIIRTGRRGA